MRRDPDQDLEQRAHRAPAAGAGKAADGGARRGARQPDQPALPLQHADLDLVADPIAAGNGADADRQAVGPAAPAAAQPGALRHAARRARSDRRVPRHREHPLRPEAAHRESTSTPTASTSSCRACCCSRWSRTRSSTGCRRRSARAASRSAASARTATRSSTSSTTASASRPAHVERVKAGGIGLRNVNERLRVIYGANYQLQLDSVPGEGTCARIVIPELRGAGEDHRVTWKRSGTSATVVVDDEQLARDELCFLLGQIGGVEVVGQAANGVEALQVIEAAEPGPGDARRADARAHRLRSRPAAGPRPAATRSSSSSPPSTSTRSRRSR